MRKNNNKFLAVAMRIIAVALISLVVMLLWNALMPQIFGITIISYWQALGLLILSRLLIGGWGGTRRKSRADILFNNDKEVDCRNKLKSMSKSERISYIKEYMLQKNSDNKPPKDAE